MMKEDEAKMNEISLKFHRSSILHILWCCCYINDIFLCGHNRRFRCEIGQADERFKNHHDAKIHDESEFSHLFILSKNSIELLKIIKNLYFDWQ